MTTCWTFFLVTWDSTVELFQSRNNKKKIEFGFLGSRPIDKIGNLPTSSKFYFWLNVYFK